MIQVIRLYPVTIINNFYNQSSVSQTYKSQEYGFGYWARGVELVQYTISLDPQYHKYQE